MKTSKEYYKKNAERIRARVRQWAKDNPERVKENRRKWAKANIEKIREYDRRRNKPTPKEKLMARKARIKRRFGITIGDYIKMFEEQDAVCAICRKPETRRVKGLITRLAIDHCHKTGTVRGLLCYRCNMILGHCDDSIELLASIIKYLSKEDKCESSLLKVS